MTNQADLDLFSVRGFLGIVSLLEDRIASNPEGLSRSAMIELTEIEHRFKRVLIEINRRKPVKDWDAPNFERLDRWFAGGFCNLLNYLEDRVNQGPSMTEASRAKISGSLTRACIMNLIEEKHETDRLNRKPEKPECMG